MELRALRDSDLEQAWEQDREAFNVPENNRGEVEGYGVYRQIPGKWGDLGGPFRLALTDRGRAHRRRFAGAWRLVGSWLAQVEQVIYRGPADDPVLLRLPEQRIGVLAEVRTMTRLVDARAAVEARGFPPGVSVEVPLTLRDPMLPDNDGPFVL